MGPGTLHHEPRLAAASGTCLGACLALTGCSGPGTCGKGPCPTATFDLHVLDDSTVSWTFLQSPAQTSTDFVTGNPSVGQCHFYYHGVVLQSGVEITTAGGPALGCNGGDQQFFNYFVWILGDPRDWSVGTFTLLNRGGATECLSCNPAAGPAGNPCIMAVLDSVRVTVVDVETATGGAAPRPKMVTDDFVRTFRVEFDTSAATARMWTGEVCRLSGHRESLAPPYPERSRLRVPSRRAMRLLGASFVEERSICSPD